VPARCGIRVLELCPNCLTRKRIQSSSEFNLSGGPSQQFMRAVKVQVVRYSHILIGHRAEGVKKRKRDTL
jgi:hypothetical protein